MIEIDGSFGEGGGQILRTSLSLSAFTNQPTTVFNIRANRPNPGIRPQHLTAINALAELCGAEVRGVEIGSDRITFYPGEIRGGNYKYDIGTAGSVTLVLQALLLPAMKCECEFEVRGGTNVPFSPPVDYFEGVFLQTLRRFGIRAELELVKRGFYPRGGGVVKLATYPSELKPVVIKDFKLEKITGISYCSGLAEHIARRQANAAKVELLKNNYSAKIKTEVSENSVGAGIQLFAFGGSILGADSLGKKGKSAEQVGREAVHNLLAEIKSGATVDRYLADQLLPYMALAGGEIKTSVVSTHTKTSAEIISKFLPVEFSVSNNTIKVLFQDKDI